MTDDSTLDYTHHSFITDPYMAIIEAIYVKRYMQHDFNDTPLSITIGPSDNRLYQWRVEFTVTDVRHA